MNKKDLRKAIKAKETQLSNEQRLRESKSVFRHIEKSTLFKESSNILLFASLPDEIPTYHVIERWASMGKNIFLPRVNGDLLDIIRYKPGTLKQGSYNIMEPQGDDIVDPAILNLIIVPGVAFDKNGNRLGRGKGFYDRLLSHATATTIAVCFNCQLVDNLPTEPHDVPVKYIVTQSTKSLP